MLKLRSSAATVFSAILFLFFIQQLTFLVESIYMLNLLNTKMDIRALGISFLLLPGLLFALRHHRTTYFGIGLVMFVCMFLSPMLSSPWRIFSSGVGAGLFLTFLGLQLTDKGFPKVDWGQSAFLATLISIVFRLAGKTLDISITGNTRYISWGLILLGIYLFSFLWRNYKDEANSPSSEKDIEHKPISWVGRWSSIRGIVSSLFFIYAVFSSPGVLARWTESNYSLIHIVFIYAILIVVFIWNKRIVSTKHIKSILIAWNGMFLLFFIANILLHRISFPTLENISPVIVGDGSSIQSFIVYCMLISSPVIFINIGIFAKTIASANPKKVAFPFMRSGGLLILCTFILIFTNTWGYVGNVSLLFRNQFYLPFLIAGIFLLFPYFVNKATTENETQEIAKDNWLKMTVALFVLMATVLVFVEHSKGFKEADENSSQLTLMTYNIQQGVDLYGNKNFEGQLRRIKEIDPDILCLQESDATRISGGNSDVVHYFSSKLGYYSYYGPKTVAGTYGTAILSRFPLENTRTIFTYSSKDEIGTAFAEISVGGKLITIGNSHPAGNDKSREEHAEMLLAETSKSKHVIAMGDYNFNQDNPYYSKVTTVLNDSWLSLYPDAVGAVNTSKLDLSIKDRKTSSGKLLPNGRIDMSDRIDHIFLSEAFKVEEAYYLPAPESETDHPLYWAVVKIKD